MPKKQKRDVALIIAIIFAAVSVSGSVIFLGTQLAGSGQADISQEAIAEAIENYADKSRKQEAIRPAGDVVAPNEEDHINGNPTARISLIEFSDFECPFCKRFHPTPEQIIKKYPQDVNWIYRHFPLDFHDPLATAQAVATECVADLAGNDAFWNYTDRVFEFTKSNGKGMKVEDLTTLAVEQGVSTSEFNECLNGGEFLEKVKGQIADGKKAGVTGTPGTIIYDNETGQKVLVGGAYPIEIFEEVIEEFLQSK